MTLVVLPRVPVLLHFLRRSFAFSSEAVVLDVVDLWWFVVVVLVLWVPVVVCAMVGVAITPSAVIEAMTSFTILLLTNSLSPDQQRRALCGSFNITPCSLADTRSVHIREVAVGRRQGFPPLVAVLRANRCGLA